MLEGLTVVTHQSPLLTGLTWEFPIENYWILSISEKKPDRVWLDAGEEMRGAKRLVQTLQSCSGQLLVWAGVLSTTCFTWPQRIKDYLSDVCVEIMRNTECHLKLLHCGLLICLESHPFLVFTCSFAISLCSILLSQMYHVPGLLVESGLQESSALLNLSISMGILNIFVNFWQYFHSLLFPGFSYFCGKYEPFPNLVLLG